jgi:hypothetical protein
MASEPWFEVVCLFFPPTYYNKATAPPTKRLSSLPDFNRHQVARRDNVQAGIHGNSTDGGFSIIDGYDGADNNQGDVLWYSGSMAMTRGPQYLVKRTHLRHCTSYYEAHRKTPDHRGRALDDGVRSQPRTIDANSFCQPIHQSFQSTSPTCMLAGCLCVRATIETTCAADGRRNRSRGDFSIETFNSALSTHISPVGWQCPFQ